MRRGVKNATGVGHGSWRDAVVFHPSPHGEGPGVRCRFAGQPLFEKPWLRRPTCQFAPPMLQCARSQPNRCAARAIVTNNTQPQDPKRIPPPEQPPEQPPAVPPAASPSENAETGQSSLPWESGWPEIRDAKVRAAFAQVERARFVPEALADQAHEDAPLPIGEGQTISQPYVIALMVQALAVRAEDRVLEIGTGSGYQTAILCALVRQLGGSPAETVYSVERSPGLAQRRRRRWPAWAARPISPWAMARPAGPRRPPLMPSSSRRLRRGCRARSWRSWPTAVASSSP